MPDSVPSSYRVFLIDEGLENAVGGASRGQLLLTFSKTNPTEFALASKTPTI